MQKHNNDLLRQLAFIRQDFAYTLGYRVPALAKYIGKFFEKPSKDALERIEVQLDGLHRAASIFDITTLVKSVEHLQSELRGKVEAGSTPTPEARLQIRGALDNVIKAAKSCAEDPAVAHLDQRPGILLLDNGSDDGAFLALHLALIGYRTQVRNSFSDFESSDHTAADAVIIDSELLSEDLDQLSAIRNLQAQGPRKTPIILVSPESDTAARLKAIRAGADGYFPRPFEPDDIVSLIREFGPQADSSAYTVIIVDDDERRAKKMMTALKRAAINSELVTDPQIVSGRLKSDPPDLVLLDVSMSSLDVRALAVRLREVAGEDVPVVLFSADSGRSKANSKREALEEEALCSEQLLAMITSHIYRRSELKNQSSAARRAGQLPKLSNQDYFLSAVENAVSLTKKGEKSFGVLYIGLGDVDRLLTHGTKEQIEAFARESEERLLVRMRGTDVATRFSDVIFGVLLKGVGPNEAKIVGERIRKGFTECLFECAGLSFQVACAVGVNLVGVTTQDAEELLSQAENAYNVAVEEPGNAVHLHDSVADALAHEKRESSLVAAIKRASRGDGLEMMFQPIVVLHDQTVEAFEVTPAVRDAEHKEIQASQLAAIAARAKVSLDLDRTVLTQAVEFVARQHQQRKPVRLMIDLSTDCLRDSSLCAWLEQLIQDHDVPSTSLVVGFDTEAVSTHLKDAQGLFQQLAKAKIATRLTHFGRSTNAMVTLKHLDVAYISVDGSMIQEVANDAQAQTALHFMVESAHTKKIKIIAPWVEDASTLPALWQCQADLIQGQFVGARVKGVKS